MRLIDADALIEVIEKMASNEWNIQVGSSKGLEDAIDVINDTPTVKPMQVTVFKGCEDCEFDRPHGKWMEKYWEEAYQESYHTCSICKKEMRTTQYDNFCPNCGAKMKGEQHGTERQD